MSAAQATARSTRLAPTFGLVEAPADHCSRFRRLVRQLHGLGPRPLGEFLLELTRSRPELEDELTLHLERYAALDPGLVAWAGGRDWLDPRSLIRAVGA